MKHKIIASFLLLLMYFETSDAWIGLRVLVGVPDWSYPILLTPASVLLRRVFDFWLKEFLSSLGISILLGTLGLGLTSPSSSLEADFRSPRLEV